MNQRNYEGEGEHFRIKQNYNIDPSRYLVDFQNIVNLSRNLEYVPILDKAK